MDLAGYIALGIVVLVVAAGLHSAWTSGKF